MKLVGFSKLGVSSTAGLSAESVPLINSDDMFDTMSMELQQLLNKVLKAYINLYTEPRKSCNYNHRKSIAGHHDEELHKSRISYSNNI